MTREELDVIARHGNHVDPEVCGFCKGQPVGNAATWLDGKPRPPAACPRCGETNYPPSDSSSAAQGSPPLNHSERAGTVSSAGVSGSLVRGGDPDPSLNPRKAA